MDDDDYPYYRNDYWDEAADRQRNARRPPPRRVIQVAGNQAAPWRPYQQPQPIVVNTARPGIRDMPTGLLAEVAAQAFVALQPLPTPPPPATDDVRSSLTNLVVYQTALAQYTKRNEQIRTLGYIARLFV
jgi:hypothetical protein